MPSLYRHITLFPNFSDHFLDVEGNGKEGKVHCGLVLPRPVCGKDKNLVHDDVLFYYFIEVFLTPGNKFGKDRHE